jgi:hypothetical protein
LDEGDGVGDAVLLVDVRDEVAVDVADWVELVKVAFAKPVATPLLLRMTPEWFAQQLGSLSQQ